jgi:hypothetical protein
MATEVIYKGEDKVISVMFKDANDVLQDIDNMANVIIYLYQLSDNTVLVKYKKVVDSDDTESIELLRVSSTEYTAILPKSITDTIDVTNLMMEAEIQETDSRFLNSIRRTKGKGRITDVKDSLIDE